MRIDIITIFPEYVAPLALSLVGKAQARGLVTIAGHDLRDFTHDKHRSVDDTPYGGGAGMVMRPQPWAEALAAVAQPELKPVLVVPTPAGQPFTQRLARELAHEQQLVFACGRYEGIDERVLEYAARQYTVRPVSLGDYVLNGGEVAALAITEAVVRLVPGVVGNPDSLVEESHEAGLLEYPVYTKPALWEGLEVPSVLLSGNHEAIASWRRAASIERTRQRRPDLLAPQHISDLVIRPAHLADAGQMWTLALAVGEQAELEVVQACIARGSAFVALDGNRVIAAAVAAHIHDALTVASLDVAPDWQRQGVARAMVTAMGAHGPVALRIPPHLTWLLAKARKGKWRRIDHDDAATTYRLPPSPGE